MFDRTVSIILNLLGVAMPVSLFMTLGNYLIKYTINAFNRDKKNQKLLEEAIAKNHAVKGTLVKTKKVKRTDPSRNEFDYITCEVGTYEYEYKGRKYRTKFTYETPFSFPKELDLYFVKNPKRATIVSELAMSRVDSWKFFWTWFFILAFCGYISHF